MTQAVKSPNPKSRCASFVCRWQFGEYTLWTNSDAGEKVTQLKKAVCVFRPALPVRTFPGALSSVLRFRQSTSFHLTWCGYLLPGVLFLCVAGVKVFSILFDSIVHLLFHIYSCFHSAIFLFFVQRLGNYFAILL